MLKEELAPKGGSMARKGPYSHIIAWAKTTYGIKIRRWRKNMSGCAWKVYYANGRTIHWVEAPYPRTPISLAIFLHEVGHHVIGFHTYRRRCEEEFHAWKWALAHMRTFRVMPDERTHRRQRLSVRYALAKALRRGLRQIPAPLVAYADNLQTKKQVA